MAAAGGWRVEAVLADTTRALLQARFVFGDDPAHLRSFPFPHELVVFAELSDQGLRISTEVRNTGVRNVPVAFGWHPVLTLDAARADTSVVLPDREHLELDGRGLPTGASRHEAAGARRLVPDVGLDESYRLPAGRVLAVAGAGRRIEVEGDERFGFAQVWAPADSRTVALEPMTAPVDALVSGDHRVVPPGGRDTATFVIRILETIEEGP
jgi:galactose mutarotase-like enzyme